MSSSANSVVTATPDSIHVPIVKYNDLNNPGKSVFICFTSELISLIYVYLYITNNMRNLILKRETTLYRILFLSVRTYAHYNK